MNILADEFRVSKYINHHQSTPGVIEDNSKQIEEAIAWSVDAMRTIIIPTGNLDDLERQWIEFNSMPKKHRRESDWKALELFGMTNQEQYEGCRSSILGNYDIENEIEKQFDSIPIKTGSEIETWYNTYKDIHTIQAGDIPVSESYIDDFSNSYYTSDAINYTSLEVEKARKWADESNRVIIIPTRTLSELEALWDAYGAMHHKHCRESDWMSLELFGVTNLKHYEYLKNQFLQQDINVADNDRYGSVIEYVVNPDMKKYFVEMCKTSPSIAVVKTLLELAIPTKSIYEDHVIGNVINTTIDTIDDISDVLPNMMVNYGDLPYFTPEDMIDMGINEPIPTDNFFGVSADNTHVTDTMTTSEWFEMYKATFNGFYTEYTSIASDWVHKVRTLMHGLDKLKESGNSDAINARKQSILELGWNPDIKFDDNARNIAKECTGHLISNKFGVTKVVDLRGFRAPSNRNSALYEDASEDHKLHPVYVILTEGKSAFSGAIKGITKSIYSHASIAFDAELKHMYSFGIENKTNKNAKGGFREEDIADVPEGGRVNVFAFFVGDEPYKKIVDLVENLKENINKTAYGYKNLFAYLFKIPMNTGNYTMFCSQFVDSCLKAAGIDITGKKPIFVAPEDINKAARNEKRIYNLYQGLASNYNWIEVKNLIDSLSKRAMPLKEHNIYFTDERSYITGILTNIHNATFLREMSSHSYLVKDKNIKRLLEDKLFDALEIRAYCESKSFPIEFDKNGDLILKNIDRIDFVTEYEKSSRSLKQYLLDGNTEGIKYEISKLWMMHCLIERKLNSKKFNELPSFAIETSSAYKAKDKVTDDFKTYLDRVLRVDPTFNFEEYYNNSPFSSATDKSNSPELNFIESMIINHYCPI